MANNGVSWDRRLLFAPLNTLSARRRTVLGVLFTLLTAAWSVWRNGDLRYAWTLPDVNFYVLMAQNRYDLVPAPFSARPLAPLLVRALSSLTHRSTENGFAVLAFVSLFLALAGVFWLAVQTHAPRWSLLLIAAVPFWPQLLGNAGLPDPLYTALLAALLLAIQADALHLAAVLMLPLMLARESTWLALVCLLAVAWRRLRPGGRLLAVASSVTGALLVHHLRAGSLPNPEHLPGGLYMAGKLASNTARSFGIVPWSNVYEYLCTTPAWQHTLHLGPVRSVGVCEFESIEPLEAISALLTVFGALPVVAIVLLRPGRVWPKSSDLLTQFSLLYGGVSFLLAPSLGTWYTRLFGYGWPLFLVALPRLLPPSSEVSAGAEDVAVPWGLLLVLHLIVWTLAQSAMTSLTLALVGALELAWAALFLVHRRTSPKAPVSH